VVRKHKALFLDIDGTLILRKQGPFPDDMDAVKRARDAGHKIFLCTGRSQANLPINRFAMPLFDGMVLAAGSHIILNNETIYCNAVPADFLRRIAAFYLASQKWCGFEGRDHIFRIHQVNEDQFEMKPLPIEAVDDFTGKYAGEVVSKLTIEGEASPDERSLLEGVFKLNPFSDYFEGIIKEDTKSKGIKMLLDKIHIPIADSIMVGDSMNDMDGVRFCGLGIAMGNACDELKAEADWVTTPVGEGGVARAIEKFLL
jgi:Cof subfamily protein (haloacid dehalogenase superfamily)